MYMPLLTDWPMRSTVAKYSLLFFLQGAHATQDFFLPNTNTHTSQDGKTKKDLTHGRTKSKEEGYTSGPSQMPTKQLLSGTQDLNLLIFYWHLV
jgi:hypothetical protein